MRLNFIFFIAMCFIATNMYANNTDSIGPATANVVPQDSISSRLKLSEETIDSLTNENLVLQNLLIKSQKETEIKEREILKLKNGLAEIQNVTVKRLEASNDSLQRKLISMASNFLYIPYDQYSIDEIAIPAFKASAGSSAYLQYRNRLPLFENYRTYILNLIDFLTKAEKATSIGLTAMRNNNASESLNTLSTLPVYRDYTGYNDWKNTYLGQQILTIQRILSSPNENTSNQLKEIRIKLEGLLNN